MPSVVGIEGFVHDEFDAVYGASARNFTERGELGAAVAVYVDGDPVVDLWGGVSIEDGGPSGPWDRDTLVCMFSVNKSVIALCAHLLADQGALEYDNPVAHYWPEFAQAGKQAMTVRQLLGGLGALVFPDQVPDGKVFDWEAVVEGLARQEPAWPIGSSGAYHASTYGHLVGELVRRVSGKTPDVYFRKEIAEPMGIDYWFAVPSGQETRVSDILPSPLGIEKTETFTRTWLRILPYPDLIGVVNDPRYSSEIMPSGFGRGNARAIAKLYAALSLGGTANGFTLLSPEALQEATTLQWQGECGLTGRRLRSAMGFLLNCPPYMPAGPNAAAFGHPGAGGSLGFADPDRRLSFAYCTNLMTAEDGVGDRCEGLVEATFVSTR
jgi:CubicO group peptidase (beta-lactamase class C family)